MIPVWFDSRRAMSLGLMLPVREHAMGGSTAGFEDLVEMTEVAREVGFDAVWFADHTAFETEHGIDGAWEAFTMLAAVAARVDGIQVGTLVTCAGFRNPGVIAKMAESIDSLTTGRFILGIGAGWNEPEYRQLGIPFDHRASRFADSVMIISSLLKTGRADHGGRFWQARNAINEPRGPGSEGPPILVGSNGPKNLRIAARFADAWNSDWQSDIGTMRDLLTQVDAACDDVGRERTSLIRTGSAPFDLPGAEGRRDNAVRGSVQQQAEFLRDMATLGLRHVVCGLDPRTLDGVRAFGEVIAAYDALTEIAE